MGRLSSSIVAVGLPAGADSGTLPYVIVSGVAGGCRAISATATPPPTPPAPNSLSRSFGPEFPRWKAHHQWDTVFVSKRDLKVWEVAENCRKFLSREVLVRFSQLTDVRPCRRFDRSHV